ncbi:MAG: alpha/beta hydrolase [Nannocystaceae bacterium]|nr:alpha/beta hydrolase [Nannocystaceae bacterium]
MRPPFDTTARTRAVNVVLLALGLSCLVSCMEFLPACADQTMSNHSEAPATQLSGDRVLKDVEYGPGSDHRLDVYRPVDAADAPIAVLVHGGAWQKGDKAEPGFISRKAEYLVGHGFVVVSVNYQLLPPDPLRQADDVARALAFVQAQAPGWGGDAQRTVLIGHSSGAHLVTLLAADPSLAAAHGAKPWLGSVALDSAALNVERIMRRRHFPFYDRVFSEDPARWREASPWHRLRTAPGPMLLVCSSQRPASCGQAHAFAEKVDELGGQARVSEIDLSHRELSLELGVPGTYTETVDAFLRTLELL